MASFLSNNRGCNGSKISSNQAWKFRTMYCGKTRNALPTLSSNLLRVKKVHFTEFLRQNCGGKISVIQVRNFVIDLTKKLPC